MTEILKDSIIYIIHCSAAVCAVIYGFTIAQSINICNRITSKNETAYKSYTFNWINFLYNVFLSLTSLFPFLGMLGTVVALLSLDLSAGSAVELQQQFFLALDTTEWGLIYSIIFKIAHAVAQTKIETAVSRIDDLIKEAYKKGEKNE